MYLYTLQCTPSAHRWRLHKPMTSAPNALFFVIFAKKVACHRGIAEGDVHLHFQRGRFIILTWAFTVRARAVLSNEVLCCECGATNSRDISGEWGVRDMMAFIA